jgi:hypothetical protein
MMKLILSTKRKIDDFIRISSGWGQTTVRFYLFRLMIALVFVSLSQLIIWVEYIFLLLIQLVILTRIRCVIVGKVWEQGVNAGDVVFLYYGLFPDKVCKTRIPTIVTQIGIQRYLEIAMTTRKLATQ